MIPWGEDPGGSGGARGPRRFTGSITYPQFTLARSCAATVLCSLARVVRFLVGARDTEFVTTFFALNPTSSLINNLHFFLGGGMQYPRGFARLP
eukprot:1196020-Prorocentrum_minimum.AAC.1